jgi:DNA repair ATPase RecN
VGGRTVADATALDVEGRIVELSRMLSGQPDSITARSHAEELLAFGSRKAPIRASSTYRARSR